MRTQSEALSIPASYCMSHDLSTAKESFSISTTGSDGILHSISLSSERSRNKLLGAGSLLIDGQEFRVQFSRHEARVFSVEQGAVGRVKVSSSRDSMIRRFAEMDFLDCFRSRLKSSIISMSGPRFYFEGSRSYIKISGGSFIFVDLEHVFGECAPSVYLLASCALLLFLTENPFHAD